MAQIVRLGDTSSHGGHMIEAHAVELNANGIPVCVNGDRHLCPIPGHGTTPVAGTSVHRSGGKALLRAGDRALCGAILITGSPDVNVNR